MDRRGISEEITSWGWDRLLEASSTSHFTVLLGLALEICSPRSLQLSRGPHTSGCAYVYACGGSKPPTRPVDPCPWLKPRGALEPHQTLRPVSYETGCLSLWLSRSCIQGQGHLVGPEWSKAEWGRTCFLVKLHLLPLPGEGLEPALLLLSLPGTQ